MYKELANLLHNAGLNAFTRPQSNDQQSWNEYREGIAKELIERGVLPPNNTVEDRQALSCKNYYGCPWKDGLDCNDRCMKYTPAT